MVSNCFELFSCKKKSLNKNIKFTFITFEEQQQFKGYWEFYIKFQVSYELHQLTISCHSIYFVSYLLLFEMGKMINYLTKLRFYKFMELIWYLKRKGSVKKSEQRWFCPKSNAFWIFFLQGEYFFFKVQHTCVKLRYYISENYSMLLYHSRRYIW